MEDIIAQIKQFPMVAGLLSDEQVKEIGEDKLAELVSEGKKHQDEHTAKSMDIRNRISELQDKAVLEGLTDDEKKEYKELKGGN